jgi:hypothetical protein
MKIHEKLRQIRINGDLYTIQFPHRKNGFNARNKQHLRNKVREFESNIMLIEMFTFDDCNIKLVKKETK